MTDKIVEKVRDIVMLTWDPLDVGMNKNLHDEYDDVVRHIISLKDNSSDVEEVFAIFLRAEQAYDISDIDESRLRYASGKIVQVTR